MAPIAVGPHGLLPPLQRETLAFERPYEAGLQWALTTARVRHRSGSRGSASIPRTIGNVSTVGSTPPSRRKTLSFPIQVHVVHEGGQLFASGAVADSVAAAAGVNVRVPMAHVDRFSIEVYGLVSRYVPDRSMSSLSRDGTAFFGRAAAERRGWRAHAIFWRGRNFIKDEGDPNYLSIARSGARYRGTRDYAELGLARRMSLARGAALEVSGRVHRVEHFYHYRTAWRASSIWDGGSASPAVPTGRERLSPAGRHTSQTCPVHPHTPASVFSELEGRSEGRRFAASPRHAPVPHHR